MNEKAIAAGAEAMMRAMFAPHELPLSDDLITKYRETFRAALAAADRVQSPELEADMHCQWCGTWHSSVLGSGGCPPHSTPDRQERK